MQPKKNPEADHSKNSSLYFVIGLSIILLITWRAIEWKTYSKIYGYEALNVDVLHKDFYENENRIKDEQRAKAEELRRKHDEALFLSQQQLL